MIEVPVLSSLKTKLTFDLLVPGCVLFKCQS